MNLINRIFGLEQINGGDRCPTYLYRWTLLRIGKSLGIYLHHFVGDDWSLDMHDHPKRFVSIGLKGRYIEETPAFPPDGRTADGGKMFITERVYNAPWIRTFPANHVHRLRMINGGDCWTLVIVFKAVREWGFWHFGEWIPWTEYVKGTRKAIADMMKNCP